ncbi:MAG: hypothetical protein ACM34J_07115 [Ignavibacteria bacterium]
MKIEIPDYYDLIVEADSVEDYLNKYYKKDRMTDTMIETYTEELKEKGYICTSRHGNITGQFIVCIPGLSKKEIKKFVVPVKFV